MIGLQGILAKSCGKRTGKQHCEKNEFFEMHEIQLFENKIVNEIGILEEGNLYNTTKNSILSLFQQPFRQGFIVKTKFFRMRFVDACHNIAHDHAVTELGGCIAEKTVGDGAGTPESRFVLGIMGRNITAAGGIMAVDGVRDQLTVGKTDGGVLQTRGKPVGYADPLFAGMEIGVPVVSHAAEQHLAAHIVQPAVAAFPVGGGVDIHFTGNVFRCLFAEGRYRVGRMLGTVRLRMNRSQRGQKTDAGIGRGHIHRRFGHIVQIGIGVGGDHKQPFFSEVVDQDVQKPFRPALHFADSLHGGVHQDGIGRLDAHGAELVMDVGFCKHRRYLTG